MFSGYKPMFNLETEVCWSAVVWSSFCCHFLSPEVYWDNNMNFWSWCLPLLQSKWPNWDFAVLQLFCLSVRQIRMSFKIFTWGNCRCLILDIQYSHLDSIQLSLQLFFCCLVWIGKNSGRREEPSIVDQSNWSQAN